MIVVVSGSRSITKYEIVAATIERSPFDITELWHGAQNGKYVKDGAVMRWVPTVDLLAEAWAEMHNVPVRPFPANWDKYGKSAGPIRNGEMATYAVLANAGLITVWDGVSRGTDDCARRFSELAIPHFEYNQRLNTYTFYPTGKYE